MKTLKQTAGGLVLAGQALLLSMVPATAHAQLAAPREAAQIEFGPISLYPSLQIVDAGKDRNVFNDESDPKEDYTFTLASRALVVTRLGLNELMFLTGSDYIWFSKYKSEQSSNLTYALRFNFSASRFKPYIGAERARTRSRPNSEIDLRARRIERNAVAGSNFNLTERTAINVSAAWSETAYEDGEVFRGTDLSEELTREGHTYSGSIRYQITPFTTLAVGGSYSQDIFPESHLRDSSTLTFQPSLEFSPDASIRGSLSAGYEVFRPEDPTLAEYKGVTASGALNWSLPSYTTFDIGLNRNVSYSYQNTEPYYVLTGASLGMSQVLFGPLSLLGTISRDHMSYRWRRGVTPVPGEPVRGDNELTMSGGFGLNLKRGFRVALGVEQSKRESKDQPLQNYRRTRLISTITVGQ